MITLSLTTIFLPRVAQRERLLNMVASDQSSRKGKPWFVLPFHPLHLLQVFDLNHFFYDRFCIIILGFINA